MSVTHNFTMNLAPGTVTFSVQGELFLILQLNSDAFSSMLDLSSSQDRPILLDDPLPAFHDWVALLFTPGASCLNPTHPSASDLGRLLELLVLCNKYTAADLEAAIVAIALPLTCSGSVLSSNLTSGLTLERIIEISHIVDEPRLCKVATELIIGELWSGEREGYSELLLGEHLGNERMIGAAYYRILVHPSGPWAADERLTEVHRHNLGVGKDRCAELWQKIAEKWDTSAALSPSTPLSRFYSSDLHTMRYNIARGKFAYYDVVGKLNAADPPSGQKYFDVSYIDIIKNNIYNTFTSEEEMETEEAALEAALDPASDEEVMSNGEFEVSY